MKYPNIKLGTGTYDDISTLSVDTVEGGRAEYVYEASILKGCSEIHSMKINDDKITEKLSQKYEIAMNIVKPETIEEKLLGTWTYMSGFDHSSVLDQVLEIYPITFLVGSTAFYGVKIDTNTAFPTFYYNSFSWIKVCTDGVWTNDAYKTIEITGLNKSKNDEDTLQKFYDWLSIFYTKRGE